ncbi:unnamed protein product [Oikopleura dioica]|uniref:WD repeat-containing protein 70 n=1 Tax=Oikopleura dioica TaxID=34765 RepID=E4XHB0_OIKDI|nr:unnamed protein product [Oikopleura dioica]
MSQKKARTFDLQAMLGETLKTAQESSRDNLAKREQDEKERREKSKKRPVSETESKTAEPRPALESEEDVGPALPPGFVIPNMQQTKNTAKIEAEKENDSDSDSESDDEEDNESRMTLPITSRIQLNHGTKPIQALALDTPGGRLLTGADDFNMKFWDFPGMTNTFEPFRYMEPQEGYHVRDISYSVTGDNILVTTGSMQPILYDRDGFLVATCVKGDNYLTDAAKTEGHMAMCNAGQFHPFEREWMVTCANDGTIRQWNVEDRAKDMFGCIVMKQYDVRKVRNKQGKRAVPTSLTYCRQGKLLASGNDDGSVQIWDHRRTVAPKMRIWNCHPAGERITCVNFSYDNNVIATRCLDGTVKLYDLRQTKQALFMKDNLPALYDGTKIAFSPNDKILCVGTAGERVKKGVYKPGELKFFLRDDMSEVKSVPLQSGSAIGILWHHRINQIIYGTSEGKAVVYFDDKVSHRGAKLCVSKRKKAQEFVEMDANVHVVVPFQPKNFREPKPSSKETQFVKARKNAQASYAPEAPLNPTMAGQLGRLNAPNGTLHKFIAKEIAMKTSDDDPTLIRQKILRHAFKAEEEGNLINAAYSQTQPINVLAEHKTLEDEDAEFNQPMWKRMKYQDDKKKGKIVVDEDKLV